MNSVLKGVEVYTKDITFLLRLLWTSKQSGRLFVEGPGPNESPWQGQLQLDEGVVTACLIRSKTDGQVVLSNDAALRWLTSQGKLVWRLEEDAQPPDPLLPALPSHEEAKREQRHDEDMLPSSAWRNQLESIPQRTQKGKAVPVNAFASREHRQVLALVDGRRTIEEIAHLLHKPPDFIVHVLQELQAAGFIA